jgi:superfamily II DNA or RNA helicase
LYKNKPVDISVKEFLKHPNQAEVRGFRIHNHLYPLTYPITIDYTKIDDYYGFEIDGNRRFVLGDFTVTHNTVMALNIISQLKKKTLILVHKEFLMNQWIERITEFMPSARVGKIQGPVFDVEGNDIVLGMIQTMHSRDFLADAFAPFGLTVIDEVHRIGSEEFSKTLFKVVTPYMLGISATVDRKDKLTKILYMNIGPKIYSEERTDDDVVNVRAIQFKSNDSEFNATEYDFRGSPKYSTMISKLCAFGPRSDFIVRIVGDLQTEHPEKQIMILAHNRDLLTYLYDAIRHKISQEENTVGYYVGGMKEKDLKVTEGRRIVLATYAMAAEALDIKTLSTLIMATPKTDIEQSVGRILRAKGQNPIVVDIVDSHDYLKRQWNTRKTFYRKCNYRILSISSVDYNGFGSEKGWKLEYDPKTKMEEVKEAKCMITIPTDILEAEPL